MAYSQQKKQLIPAPVPVDVMGMRPQPSEPRPTPPQRVKIVRTIHPAYFAGGARVMWQDGVPAGLSLTRSEPGGPVTVHFDGKLFELYPANIVGVEL